MIILLLIIVLSLRLTKGIFNRASDSVNVIEQGIKQQINNLLAEENKNLVIALGSQKIARVKQGTENYGIAIGFAPDNPAAWETNKQGCTYSIEGVEPIRTYGLWDDLLRSGTFTKGYSNVSFNEVDNGRGYALIFVNVPSHDMNTAQIQRFELTVNCKNYPEETAKEYFDIEVIEKRGIF